MGSLGLELSSCEAKLVRAREHLETLKAESDLVVHKGGLYTIRVRQTEIDPETGWCSVFLIRHEMPEPRLGVILGDAVHNLRCALDYIVEELAVASGLGPSKERYFPIFESESAFRRRVLAPDGKTAKKHGPLEEIRAGLTEITRLQPYQRQPDPRGDPLWLIQRLSNADKHRELSAFRATFPTGEVLVAPRERLIDTRPVQPPALWPREPEIEVARCRFSGPFPLEAHVKARVSIHVNFVAKPLPGERESVAADVGALEACHSHVEAIVRTFERL